MQIFVQSISVDQLFASNGPKRYFTAGKQLIFSFGYGKIQSCAYDTNDLIALPGL